MLLLKLIYNGLKEFSENCQRDKRISSYPLLGKPWPMLTIIALYLLVVLKLGPKFMAKRKPYKVEGLMKIYNIVQIFLNAFIVYEAIKYSVMRSDFRPSCQRYNPDDTLPGTIKLVRPAYLYYISKYLDFCDTLFFLLRKKFNQISFLHVYHHALMVCAVFIYCSFLFSSHFDTTGIVNAFVHVCMYTYYFVAASKTGVNLEPWKRNLTRLQLVQFSAIVIFIGIPIINNWCNLSYFWLWITFLQNLFMLALFSNFYYNNYVLKDLKQAKLSSHKMLK